jgi:hypothetical protein
MPSVITSASTTRDRDGVAAIAAGWRAMALFVQSIGRCVGRRSPAAGSPDKSVETAWYDEPGASRGF